MTVHTIDLRRFLKALIDVLEAIVEILMERGVSTSERTRLVVRMHNLRDSVGDIDGQIGPGPDGDS